MGTGLFFPARSQLVVCTWIQRPRVTATSRNVNLNCLIVTTDRACRNGIAYCASGSASGWPEPLQGKVHLSLN